MHYVVLASHSPDICPSSNAKTKGLLLDLAPQIPSIAQKHGVNIVAGPFVNREHMTVVIVETDRAEGLDDFLVDSRLGQWNQVHILPSRSLQEGLTEIQESASLF
ncbi:MAG TPA: hypothetical protein VK836_16095 [Streptosporangiaceae bacterium]|nr:hypothetical protein [Streptosporangiaceae bacterium]